MSTAKWQNIAGCKIFFSLDFQTISLVSFQVCLSRNQLKNVCCQLRYKRFDTYGQNSPAFTESPSGFLKKTGPMPSYEKLPTEQPHYNMWCMYRQDGRLWKGKTVLYHRKLNYFNLNHAIRQFLTFCG